MSAAIKMTTEPKQKKEIINNTDHVTPKTLIKVFIGYPLSKELSLHLEQSAHWQEAKLLCNPKEIQIISYEDKAYLGLFIQEKAPHLTLLSHYQKHIEESLKKYCPNFNRHQLSPVLFSQVFIS